MPIETQKEGCKKLLNPSRYYFLNFLLEGENMLSNCSAGRSQSYLPRNTNTSNSTPRPDPATVPDKLWLGAGNLSLPLTFVLNRMDLIRRTNPGPSGESEAALFPSTVLVTEFKTRRECLQDPETRTNLLALTKLGSPTMFGVDGRKLDETFPGQDFSRIQIDCPDVGRGHCDVRRELPDTIDQIAFSAAGHLKPGSTLHFTLITPENSWKVWDAVQYEISRVERHGFYLNEGAPRVSGPRRYTHLGALNSTYTHNKTEGPGEVAAALLGEMSEYVYVRDPIQRTPARYLGTTYGYRQRTLGDGTTERVEHGAYPCYIKPPGPPSSPKIQPPSFFDTDRFGLTAAPTVSRSIRDPYEHESTTVKAAHTMDDDLDAFDLSDLSRATLRNMSRQTVKRSGSF